MKALLYQYIERLRSFCFSHIRFGKISGLLIVGCFVLLLFLPSPVQADVTNDLAAGAVKIIFLPLARFFQKITLFEVGFLQILASYNGYLESTAVNVGWVVVRDVANMGFVIILLVIAFATILGWEAYEWKKLLPKMVMAAVLINFSRTICGVLIDASQVLIMTFLNAISATISGNVIQSFYFASFEKFHTAVSANSGSALADVVGTPGIVVASMVAVAFSALVAIMMGFYVAILLARVVRLWVLIVFSPLAFIFSILPATQGYAKQWWDELMDDLVTGPVILFFIWLAFVVVGSGQINQELLSNSDSPNKEVLADEFKSQTAGVTDILGWNNMANLIIGIGILMVGVRVSGQIGGSSGSIMSSALTFGKRVATIASGYAAGRWLYEKGADAVKAVPGALYGATLEKPIERIGREIKARAALLGKMTPIVGSVARDKWAAERQKKGGIFNAVGAWLVETGARKDKKVSDYEKAVESAEFIHEESMSTSSTAGGKEKLRMGELARSFEELASKKKVEKLEGERNKQNEKSAEIGKVVAAAEAKLKSAENEYKAADKAYKENASTENRQARKEAEKRMSAAQKALNVKRGNFSFDDLMAYDNRKATADSVVKGEKVSEKVREEDRLAIARQRDALSKDKELEAQTTAAHKAAIAAEEIEKGVRAKEELEKINLLKDIKEELKAKEATRIRAEEEAKVIREEIDAKEKLAAAKIEDAVRRDRGDEGVIAAEERAEAERITQAFQEEGKMADIAARQKLFSTPEMTSYIQRANAAAAESEVRQGLLSTKEEVGAAKVESVVREEMAATEEETLRQKSLLERIKGRMASSAQLQEIEERVRAGKQYEDLDKQILADQGFAMELKTRLDEDKEIAQANEQDKELVKEGRLPVRVKEIQAKHFARRQDIYKSVNFDQMMAYIDNLNAEFDKLSDLEKVASNPKYQNLLREREHVLTYTASQGGEYAMYAADRLNKGAAVEAVKKQSVGFDENDQELNAQSARVLQAQVLSAALRKEVKAEGTAIEGALEELQKLHEARGTSFEAFMDTLINNLNQAAGDGGINKAGLFRADHKADGSKSYKAVNLNAPKDSEDVRHWRGKRLEALSHSTINRMSSIADSLDRNGEGDLVIESEQGLKFIRKVFGNINHNTAGMVNEKVVDELDQAFRNMSKDAEGIAKIEKVINTMLSQTKNAQGVLKFLDRLDSVRGSYTTVVPQGKGNEVRTTVKLTKIN